MRSIVVEKDEWSVLRMLANNGVDRQYDNDTRDRRSGPGGEAEDAKPTSRALLASCKVMIFAYFGESPTKGIGDVPCT